MPLREDDNLITAYRDHGMALARGLEPNRIMAEMIGKSTGVSKGKGGSMHLADVNKHFWGGYAVVGGHLPLAAGFALADQYNGDDRVTLALMGDGATQHRLLPRIAQPLCRVEPARDVDDREQPVRHGHSGHSCIGASIRPSARRRRPMICLLRAVDGKDLAATVRSIQQATEYCRSGNGPAFIEAHTYRFSGHSMGDPERYRNPEEIEQSTAARPD